MNEKKIIAVDFDGTLCKDAYPNIGEPLPYSLYYIKELAAAGNILILHTCRSGELLDAAVAWCKERGITFNYINENVPENIKKYGGDTRKIYADIYVDTNAVNPRRLFGIGELNEHAAEYKIADGIARRELCDNKCLCPDIRAAGMCCDCDVFLALRSHYALRVNEAINKHAVKLFNAAATFARAAVEFAREIITTDNAATSAAGGAQCQDTKK